MYRRFLINRFENIYQKELKEKISKKGLLVKVLTNNKRKTDSLIEILKDTDDLNALKKSFQKITEEEYLSKFRNIVNNRFKHSIADQKANYLSEFLNEFIINAFQLNYFDDFDLFNEKFSFEISRVQLMSDLSSIKIFWFICENEKFNILVENCLENKVKSEIRDVLLCEKVINYVPKIIFIRDESRMLMSQIDDYLSQIKNKTELNQVISKENKCFSETSTVNNLYGINTDSMIENIKSNSFKENYD